MMYRIFSNVIKKVINTFSNMKLLTKLTTAYTVVILIPAILIGIYSYNQSQRYVKDEIVKGSWQTLLQRVDNINYKMMLMQSVCDNIAYNTRIKRFLNNEYILNFYNLDDYKNIISTLIEDSYNFQQANIYNIRIFMNNKTIPENWSSFFSEDRIKGLDWYKKFKEEHKDSLWVGPHRMDSLNNEETNDRIVYTFVKKINAQGSNKYLGIAAVNILQKDMFSSMSTTLKNDEVMFVMDGSGNISYSSKDINKDEMFSLVKMYDKGKEGNFTYNGMLYLFKDIEQLNIRVVNQVPISELVSSMQTGSRNIIFAIIIGVVILELITYYILKIIVSKLKLIVGVMNNVSKGDFDVRIPVNQKDEIGQLALDFNVLIEKINQLIKDLLSRETAQKDAQLMALQYQINPHFIYNTIDIFRMKMELAGDYQTADAITDFGKMLRYTINNHDKYSTINGELEQVKKYIGLQQLKYGDKVALNINVQEDLLGNKILRFILQPLVENCIKHGFSSKRQTIHIDINFEKFEDKVSVEIVDDGAGIEVDKLETLNCQFKDSIIESDADGRDSEIGLYNINERLKLFYGEKHQILIESRKGEFTKVSFDIPFDDISFSRGENGV